MLNNKQQTTNNKILNFISKFRLFSFFLIVLFIASCSNNNEDKSIEKDNLISEEIMNRDVGESCFSNDLVAHNICSNLSETMDVIFDEYPGCTFTISYSYILCNDQFTGGKYIYLESLELDSHDCDAYNFDVLQAQQNGTLSELSLHFDRLLYDAVTDDLGQLAHSFPTVTIQFNTVSCAQYCYIIGTKKGFTYYTFRETRCGGGCCVILKEYYEEDGTLESNIIDFTEYLELEECNVDIVACYPGAVFTSDCTFRCDAFL